MASRPIGRTNRALTPTRTHATPSRPVSFDAPKHCAPELHRARRAPPHSVTHARAPSGAARTRCRSPTPESGPNSIRPPAESRKVACGPRDRCDRVSASNRPETSTRRVIVAENNAAAEKEATITSYVQSVAKPEQISPFKGDTHTGLRQLEERLVRRERHNGAPASHPSSFCQFVCAPSHFERKLRMTRRALSASRSVVQATHLKGRKI